MKESTRLALEVIQGAFGVDAATLLSDAKRATDNCIPTGIPAFDWGVLGIGGIPKGRFIEVYGKKGAGKSSLIYKMMAAFQGQGIVPVVIDPKASITEDIDRVVRFGVDAANLIFLPVRTSEDALVQAKTVIQKTRGKGVDLAFFWDDLSLTATQSVDTTKKGRGEKDLKVTPKVAEKAKVMWDFCRALSGECYRNDVTMVIVNHMTAVIKTGFFAGRGPTETTTGGGGIKAAARIRVKLVRKELVKKGSKKVGQVVIATTEANAYFRPFCSALLYLDFVEGYDPVMSTLLNGLDEEAIRKVKGKYRARSWKKGVKPKAAEDWAEDELNGVVLDLWPHAKVSAPVAVRSFGVAVEEDEDEGTDDEEDEIDALMDDEEDDYGVDIDGGD